ncbi:hypothetical protein [Croceivirga thetidis]|uniref:hypothetical protein n=1 Tax=Croceivirga thetidis TaxID=2721623 RepID=UPI001B2FEF56|nr:hypothetical protein [Croceivirga thetidis]
MKNLLFGLVLLFFIKGNAQIENDKILHFVGGNLYGLAGAGIAKQVSNGNRFWTFAGAIGGSALVGLGKEAIDSNPNGSGWDNGDLLATILGGATVGITIDIFTDHKKNRKTKPQGGLTVGFVPELQELQMVDNRLPTLSELALPTHILD